jgi:hypothetical protein
MSWKDRRENEKIAVPGPRCETEDPEYGALVLDQIFSNFSVKKEVTELL